MTIAIDCAETLEQSSFRCAAALAAVVAGAVAERGRCALALAGGSTPRRLYERLAEQPFRDTIPWPHLFLFWGDERCLAPDHPDSNYRLVAETLLDRVPIVPEQIFPMPGTLDPESGARAYERTLRDFFGIPQGIRGCPRFDLILLGLGADGHTASLFPGSALLDEGERWVAPAAAPETALPAVPRLTLTLPLLNRARHLFFLVSGAAKERIADAILARAPQAMDVPAARIEAAGDCRWFLSGVDCRRFFEISQKAMP